MTPILARPEARWALWAGIAGAIVSTVLAVKGIFASGSSTAAIGFIFVPIVAVAFAVPSGIWGMALGHVLLVLARQTETVRALFIAALLAAIAPPVVVVYEVYGGIQLERAVHEVLRMEAPQLEHAFDASPWRHNKFFLGAVAQNKAASGALLSRMADLDNPELFEPMGSLWDVMGENRKGLSVMRLIARHANTRPLTLAKLEENPQSQKLISEILANPNTPRPVLMKHANDTYYLAEWGLALNPNAPREILERLSRSENLYARMNLTYNKAAPRELLERLARDPDPILARNAAQALDRR